MSKKNVSAATVRAWARENISLIPEGARACLGDTARGRLHPEVTEAFAKANRGKTYEPRVAEANTVTVPVVTLDSRGRKTTVKRTLTTAEARQVLGGPAKGRLSHANLSDVLSQREADAHADTFK